ncbi:MAG: hypothetical protein JWO64_254 [Hyphomicrobiales bacterium]|jgi:hypothetical protein|nr:hypothetical protein [Hyphomicrobiales bacterium]
MDPQRTILVTFAGRRDRMQLLTRYVTAAMDAGLIDEWHVWDFTRNAQDAAWLRERFPVVQTTPSHTLEYFRCPGSLTLTGDNLRASIDVRARSDVHIGLKRTSGTGPSFEIVLGGWGNAISAIRTFASADELTNVAGRMPDVEGTKCVSTPSLMPEFDFAEVDLEIGDDGVKVFFNDALLISNSRPVEPGTFELLYRTGYGSNGDWRFPGFKAAPARLFVCGPEPHHPADAMFYTRAYQFYVANRDLYRDDVILKCDDDIVSFDLTRLAEFIAFRKAHRQYLLVSANVINNGVCAHFQQQAGAIPLALLECELPPGGMCGKLWSDGEKAQELHELFLRNPESFTKQAPSPILWNERVSINFIALLGADLKHIPDIMADDEHDLCYGVRKRARRSNCIYQGFVAAHLSFWKQDAAMKLDVLLQAYESFADRQLATFVAHRPASEPCEEALLEPLPLTG